MPEPATVAMEEACAIKGCRVSHPAEEAAEASVDASDEEDVAEVVEKACARAVAKAQRAFPPSAYCAGRTLRGCLTSR